jgi:hypothetical protein
VNLRILASIFPLGVFYGFSRVADPWVAVLAGFAASSVVFYYNRQSRLIGTLTAFGFVLVAVSAVVGIAANSEKAYLASGPIGDFLFVPLYLGSILIGRPIIGGIARELLPKYAGHLPANAPVFVWMSVVWAIYDTLHGLGRVWLLQELSTGQYIIWSRVLFWPISIGLVGLTGLLVMRAGQRYAGVPEEGGEAPGDVYGRLEAAAK